MSHEPKLVQDGISSSELNSGRSALRVKSAPAGLVKYQLHGTIDGQ